MPNPYDSLPDYCFWGRDIARKRRDEVDPVIQSKFKVRRTDRVVTAGSCFAQHIARHLAANKFNYFVTESVHPVVKAHANEYGYGLFSARYGNIYTSRQLLQTLKRAYGLFVPREDIWEREDGRLIDPFRPRIQPNGFACREEYWGDRAQHFAAIRRAVEQMDVFVFTLGLTEGWAAIADGAAFPLCPGVAGGHFDPSAHVFMNLTAEEVITDLSRVLEIITVKNSKARIILTVSPVPLVATMEDRSVLVSTTYSKSVLRVAAEELAKNANVAYFPSYEIITGSYTRGCYFAPDLRSVTEAGVAHVMDLFMRHYASDVETPRTAQDSSRDTHEQTMQQMADVMCDEEVLDSTHRATTVLAQEIP